MMASRSRSPASVQRQRRGATVVEFALVAPVMFLFIFGIFEFGRMMMVQQAVTNAAREGCRKASLVTTINSTDVDTVVRNVMESVIADASNTAKVRVNVTPTNMASLTSGTPVSVDVEVSYSDVSWPPGGLLDVVGNPVIRAEATQERE